MTALMRLALLYALVPVCFTILGAAIGVCWPSLRRLRGHVLHLAAGVVFSVVAVELLPEIQRRALVGDVALGFALGIGSMLIVDRVLDRMGRGGHDAPAGDDRDSRGAPSALAPAMSSATRPVGVPLTLMVAVSIDFLLGGFLLGVGFAAGRRIGILLALAEAAEQLSVGLALATEMTRAGVARGRVVAIVSALGMLVFISAGFGATVLGGLTGGAMEIVLSFGLAALLYLVTEELLREAHEERATTIGTGIFFLGSSRF